MKKILMLAFSSLFLFACDKEEKIEHNANMPKQLQPISSILGDWVYESSVIKSDSTLLDTTNSTITDITISNPTTVFYCLDYDKIEKTNNYKVVREVKNISNFVVQELNNENVYMVTYKRPDAKDYTDRYIRYTVIEGKLHVVNEFNNYYVEDIFTKKP
ncbi:MAG: hypothetical protein Q3983_06430 [Capnocytophaga sp.]|nr:hypothetical protein [Capnocytophaga sp.]